VRSPKLNDCVADAQFRLGGVQRVARADACDLHARFGQAARARHRACDVPRCEAQRAELVLLAVVRLHALHLRLRGFALAVAQVLNRDRLANRQLGNLLVDQRNLFGEARVHGLSINAQDNVARLETRFRNG
jgi:hypothetical protein